jgi:hypothetical protein
VQLKRSGKIFLKVLADKTAGDQITPRKIFCNISKSRNETSKLANATMITNVVENSTFKKIAHILINVSCRRIYWIFKKILINYRMFCKKRSEQNMVQTIGSGSLVLANNSKKIDKKFYNKAQIKIQNSRKNMKILIQNQIGIIKKSLQNQLRSLIKFDSNRKKYQI